MRAHRSAANMLQERQAGKASQLLRLECIADAHARVCKKPACSWPTGFALADDARSDGISGSHAPDQHASCTQVRGWQTHATCERASRPVRPVCAVRCDAGILRRLVACRALAAEGPCLRIRALLHQT